MDGYKFTREDAMAFGGGIILLIGLFVFPWHTYSLGPVSFDQAATDSPDSVWGVLALIGLIAILIDLAVARFSPGTQIPTTQLGRDMTRVAACGVMWLFLFIKFVVAINHIGWGFFVDVILAIVVTAGCWFIAMGKATPLNIPTSGGGAR
jgi:hypothetical protein